MTNPTFKISRAISEALDIPFVEILSCSDKKLSKHASLFDNYVPYGGGGKDQLNGHYGKKHSKESKELMRRKALGRIPYNKGVPNHKQRDRMFKNNPMKNPKISQKVAFKNKGRIPVNKIKETFDWNCKWCNKTHTNFNTYKNRKLIFCGKSCAASYSNTHRYS